MSFIPTANMVFHRSLIYRLILWIMYMEENLKKWNSKERQREYFQAYRKKRKQSFKERGICPNCEKRAAAPKKVCCVQCLEDKKLTLKFGSAGPYRQLYAEMFERQSGNCGICRKLMMRPVLDHCHKTMVVRGLLCQNCNIGLGQFKDNANLLKSALNYIQNNAGVGIEIKRRDKN